jgi:integrase
MALQSLGFNCIRGKPDIMAKAQNIRQRTEGGVWYADFTQRGRRFVRSTGTTNQQEAQEIADRWKSEAWRESNLGEKPSVTFEQAAGALAKAKADLRDIEGLKDKLRWIAGVSLRGKKVGKMPVRDITRSVIDGIVEAKRKEGRAGMVAGAVSNSTLNRYLAAISVVLNFSHRKEWLEYVPKFDKLSEPAGSFLWLTKEQANTLLAELPPHLEVMARFALATGLRRSNVTHLTWEQVDMQRGVAWIDAENSKSGEAIAIPLSDDAIAVLKQQKGVHKDWVFPYNGKPVHTVYADGFKKALVRAGLDPAIRWHTFRHTWATWHVMQGTPIGELMKLGGWHSLDLVMRYAKFAPGHLKQFANNSQLQIGNRQPDNSVTPIREAA